MAFCRLELHGRAFCSSYGRSIDLIRASSSTCFFQAGVHLCRIDFRKRENLMHCDRPFMILQ